MPSPTAPAGRGDFGRGRPITPDLRAARRNAIIESAYAVLTERGYERTAMSDIAKHAGVGQATVYRYFESKRELLDHVFDYAVLKVVSALDFESLIGSVQQESEPPAALIRSLGQKLFALIDEDPALLRVITVESSAIDPELRYRVIGLLAAMDASLAKVVQVFAPDSGLDHADLEMLGRMMLGSATPGLRISLAKDGSAGMRAAFLKTMESVAARGLFNFSSEDARA